jgi:DNA-binding NarL/FixJ family response regulator
MDKINIIIVDDHLLFSQSLSVLIRTFKDFNVMGTFSNGKDFINHFSTQTVWPELLLLDVNMPIMDGIETMKWIKTNNPELKVIALSVNNDEITILKMLTNGAKGYLLKDTEPNIFKEALLGVYEKGFYYTEMISGILINKIEHKNNKDFLKERELEFIKLACTELTYKEIANEMCLSPKTIDGYRENLFLKLEVKTRIGLVLFAIKNKIIML